MSEPTVRDMINHAIGDRPVDVQSAFNGLMIDHVRKELSGARDTVALDVSTGGAADEDV